jgi:hypothetical protein
VIGVNTNQIKLTVIARREATKQSPDPSPILDKIKPPLGGLGVRIMENEENPGFYHIPPSPLHFFKMALKYSTVFASPVSASILGDQPNSFKAREISGFRCFGSSCGRGR